MAEVYIRKTMIIKNVMAIFMLVFLSFIMSLGDEAISKSLPVVDASYYASGNDIDQSGTYMVSLVTLLIVNVVIMVVNFIFDRISHRKDNHNHKVHLIAQKGIEVESSVYERFQAMALLHPGEEHQLLDLIMVLDSYLNNNRLYIEKKFLNHSIEFLDYFKRIQHCMYNKDVKKEETYFEKLSKAFYGE